MDADKKEHLRFWDCDDIETLDTYKGKVRVIRAAVSNLLQLFVYRRLGHCRRPKDPIDTIRHIPAVELQLTPRRSRAQVGRADAPAR
jgi:hypothetical protein